MPRLWGGSNQRTSCQELRSQGPSKAALECHLGALRRAGSIGLARCQVRTTSSRDPRDVWPESGVFRIASGWGARESGSVERTSTALLAKSPGERGSPPTTERFRLSPGIPTGCRNASWPRFATLFSVGPREPGAKGVRLQAQIRANPGIYCIVIVDRGAESWTFGNYVIFCNRRSARMELSRAPPDDLFGKTRSRWHGPATALLIVCARHMALLIRAHELVDIDYPP